MRWSLFGRFATSQTPRRSGPKRFLAVELLESRVLLSSSNAPIYGHVDEMVSVEAALPNTTSFVKSFGGSGWDTGETIIQTSDGGYAVLGSTKSFGAGGYDFWMLRLDAKGHVVWQKTFGGSDNEIGRCVIQTSDGGLALAGLYEDVVELELPHGIQRSLLAKLDAARERLEVENFVAASNNLEAFIHHVEAQRGKKIPEEAADQLTVDAQLIIDLLSEI